MTDATPTPTPPKSAPKPTAKVAKALSTQEAVDALIASLITIPRANIAEITITAKGRVRIAGRDRSMQTAASIRPLDEEPPA